MNLIEALSKDSGIAYISRGGCAKYAVALSKRLMERGIRHQIVYLYSPWFGGLMEYLLHKRDGAAACDHAVIRINGQYFDGEGIIPREKVFNGYACNRAISFDRCNKHITENRWNPTFEQSHKNKGIQVIEKYLDSIFNSLDNE